MSKGLMPVLWGQIYRQLINELAAGQYPVGSCLPTETKLSFRFGVNRHTVRRALNKLSDDGLVHSRRGAGVFVISEPLNYRLDAQTRFSTHLSHPTLETTLCLVHCATRPASDEDVQLLQIDKQMLIHHVEGIRKKQNIPLMRFKSLFPAEIVPNFVENLKISSGITEALKKSGVTAYSRKSSIVSAVAATTLEAQQLMVDENSPLLQVNSINILDNGRIIEAGQTLMAAERITLTVESHR